MGGSPNVGCQSGSLRELLESCPRIPLWRDAFVGWGVKSWMPEAEGGIWAGLGGEAAYIRRRAVERTSGDITDRHRGIP